MNYKIEDLTKEEAIYIGEKINEIVPHEVDAEVEKFVLKVENENGEIIGGCIAEAYEYHWLRMFLNTLWVDERYRHHGIEMTFRLYPIGEDEFGRKGGMLKVKFGEGCLMFDDYTCKKR